MRISIMALLALIALSGCGTQAHPVPQVRADDPVFAINPGFQSSDANALIHPLPGAPR